MSNVTNHEIILHSVKYRIPGYLHKLFMRMIESQRHTYSIDSHLIRAWADDKYYETLDFKYFIIGLMGLTSQIQALKYHTSIRCKL